MNLPTEFTEESIVRTLQVLYRSLRIPLSLVNASCETILCLPAFEHHLWPSALVAAEVRKMDARGLPPHFPAMTTDHFDIHVGMVRISEDYQLVLGPASSAPLDPEALRKTYGYLSGSAHDQAFLNAYRVSIPADAVRFANALSLTVQLFHGIQIRPAEILEKNFPIDRTGGRQPADADTMPADAKTRLANMETTLADAETRPAEHLISSPESHETDFQETLLFERMLLAAIRRGNLTELEKVLNTAHPYFRKQLPHRAETEPYIQLPVYVLMRHAAILGGADQRKAYRLYDRAVAMLPSLHSTPEHLSAFIDLAKALCTLSAEAGFGNLHQTHRRQIEAYISRHLTERITKQDLANLCHVSGRQISRIFEEGFHMPLPEYIHRERIAKAASFLLTSNYTIAEIAGRLGYASQSHFSTTFKKYMGVTPGEYQKDPSAGEHMEQ